MIYLGLLLASCWIVTRRLVGESCGLLAPALAFGLACATLMLLANGLGDVRPALGVFALASGLLALKVTPAPLTAPRFSRLQWALILLFCLVIWGYTQLSQNLVLDDDFWIHQPVQGLLSREGLPPPSHPFLPDIVLKGHYGRDLLISAQFRLTGSSTFVAQAWQTVLAQVASFLVLLGLVRRSGYSAASALLAGYFVFFGINVGGRAGLLDTCTNNNPLAYLLVLILLRLLSLVCQHPTPARVVITSLTLAALGLVYETHFGLVGLTLLFLVALRRRWELALVGVLSLALACSQGGPLSHLWTARPTSLTVSEMAQHQTVELTFPKTPPFQIRLNGSSFQRRSVAYSVLSDWGWSTPVTEGEGYYTLWSWDVLKIHWLSTLLAPWSLFVLVRWSRDGASDPMSEARAPWVGLSFWAFGFSAFLTPGLVHFGPVFESESFRWQFAAGFGFAAALGVALGCWLEKGSRRVRVAAAVVIVALNTCAAWTIPIPRMAGLAGAASPVDGMIPRAEGAWVLGHSANLSGFDFTDLCFARLTRRLSRPADRILMNQVASTPRDIYFASTFLGLCGLPAAGYSLPWENEGVGTPPFHPSAPARVFWRYPSQPLLDQLEADWVLYRPGGSGNDAVAHWLESHCSRFWFEGGYRLFRVRSGESGVVEGCSREPASRTIQSWPALPRQAKTAEFIEVHPEDDGTQVWAWGFVKQGASAESVDCREVVTWTDGRTGVIAPAMPGDYDLRIYEVKKGWLHPSLEAYPLRAVERTEAQELQR